MSQPLLHCHQLSCQRDGRSLFSGLDMRACPGDIVQIEGPNGSGKTSLLRAISGLFSDYEGDIHWQGQALKHNLSTYRANILYIGHRPGLKHSLSPRENLAFLTRLHGSSAINDGELEAALAKVGLYGYEDMPGYQLSAGQMRRVALARLYLSRAVLWVLDEPYTAIDKQGIADLEDQFKAHADAGGAVILSSHQSPNIEFLTRINLLDYPAASTNAEGGVYDE